MRKLMEEFSKRKRSFGDNQWRMKMDLPEPLDNLTMDNRVVQGEFTIP
jgi:hypothetical protein